MRKILLFTLVMFSLLVRGQGTITFISTNSEDNALDFGTSITDNAAAQIKYCNDISNYVITFKESTTLTDAEKGTANAEIVYMDSFSGISSMYTGNEMANLYYLGNWPQYLSISSSKPFRFNGLQCVSLSEIIDDPLIVYGYLNGNCVGSVSLNVPGEVGSMPAQYTLNGTGNFPLSTFGIVDKVILVAPTNTKMMCYNNFEIATPSSVTLAESSDNSSLITLMNGVTIQANLTRTLKAGQWNSFCVPFNISSSVINNTFGASTVVDELVSSSYSNGTVAMNFGAVTDGIKAGVPYLIKPQNTVANPSFTDVTISSATTPTTTTCVTFTGITSPFALTIGNKSQLFLSSDGTTLQYPSTGTQMNGMRGYFTLTGDAANTANAKSFSMSFDGGNATDIETVNVINGNASSDALYSTTGQRVNESYKGIVIKNGKKYINK